MWFVCFGVQDFLSKGLQAAGLHSLQLKTQRHPSHRSPQGGLAQLNLNIA